MLIEFQEFICRIAHYSFLDMETIEYKVYWLFKVLWQDRYDRKVWTKDKIPLCEVNYSY